MTDQNLPKIDDAAIQKVVDNAKIDEASLQKTVGSTSSLSDQVPSIVQTIKSVQQKLSGPTKETANKPYVVEMAVYIVLEHREGRPVDSLLAAATTNGVSEAQLIESIKQLDALPDYSEAAFRKLVHETYLEDGRRNGYIGADSTPTTWVAGQLARAYYGE